MEGGTGSIILFPNSLRILDRLGIFETIHAQGFGMTTMTTRDASFKAIGGIQMSSRENYGYAVLRVPRAVLLSALVAEAAKRGIRICYEHKLVSLAENAHGAVCRFASGIEKECQLVVGADVFRSRVRDITFPDAPAPSYTGQTGICWTTPHSELKYSCLGDGSSNAMLTPQGVCLLMPETSDGTQIFIVTQRPLAERTFSEWKELGNSKKKLLEVLRSGAEEIPEPMKSAITFAEHSPKNEFFLWPYYVMSTLDHWVSQQGNIVLLGDAAHAFPPIGGLGAGMAIEDADGLGLILRDAHSLSFIQASSLSIWESWREDRLARVTLYVTELSKNRAAPPKPVMNGSAMGGKVEPTTLGDSQEMAWLYDWHTERELVNWLL